MTTAKKVPITLYVPAGEWCESYTYTCPLLQNGYHGLFCAIVVDTFWPTHGWIKKPKDCPSRIKKRNAMTDKDVVNERLRTFKKAAKSGHLDTIFGYGDENGDEYELD